MEKTIKIRTNFIYNLVYQILTIILPLVTAPYVSRVLKSNNIGVYSYTQAAANYFFLFAMLGVNNYGNRTIAAVRDDKEKLSAVFWEIYVFQFIIGLIVNISYLVYCLCFIKQDVLVSFLQFFYVASAIFNINWLCFGLEKFKLTTIRNILVRLGMAVAVFLFVKKETDLPIYTAILAGGNLISVLVIWPFALKYVPFRKPKVAGIVRHIKPNLVLFWPVVAISLYNIMDKLMLGAKDVTKQEVGFYTYAENIVQIPNTLILALDNVIMPRMSNLYANEKESAATNLMNHVMLFAMLASAAMAFGLASVSPVFVPWFYGEEFMPCILLVSLLCPVIIFKGWAGALRTQYIIPKKKDRIYIISLTAGAIVNLIINYFLIPIYAGIGAAIGTIAAEFSVAFIQFLFVRKEVPIMEYIKNGIAFCIIGICMFAIIYNMRDIPLDAPLVILIQIITGGVVYMSAAVFYIVKVKKNPVLINEGLKMLHIKYRFK